MMTDSDGDSEDESRSRKRPKKTNTVSAAAVARPSDEERAAQMTPAQIVALLKQMEQEHERNKTLETNLAKAQRKLRDTVKTNARMSSSRARIPPSSYAIVPITTKAEKLPDLKRQEKERVLKKISFGGEDDAKDKHKTTNNARGLQVLIWGLGCNYCLQKHQFLGVRAVTGGMLDDFPRHLDLDSSPQKIQETLKRAQLRISDRGVIIADVMGLGKTVEAVTGAILRNAIADVKKKPKKPTLICSPNEAVLVQWHQTLIKAGVDKKKIYRFRTKKSEPLAGDIFVLCTMYDLQTELRYCFDIMKRVGGNIYAHCSPLFASSPGKLLCVLKNQYRAEKGKEKNKYNRDGDENVNECIRRHLGKQESNCSLAFRTVILDEAVSSRSLSIALAVRQTKQTPTMS